LIRFSATVNSISRAQGPSPKKPALHLNQEDVKPPPMLPAPAREHDRRVRTEKSATIDQRSFSPFFFGSFLAVSTTPRRMPPLPPRITTTTTP